MNPIKCLNKNVILMFPGDNNQTKGGIFVPEGTSLTGGSNIELEVFMVADDVTKVKVGDIVLKPDVTIVSSRRGVDHDLVVTDTDGQKRKAIVVEEDDIRVIMWSADRALPAAVKDDGYEDGDMVPVDNMDDAL